MSPRRPCAPPGLALASLLLVLGAPAERARPFDSSAAYELLRERVGAARSAFFVYRDADSGLNHGFPSGFFGKPETVVENKIELDAACIDDPLSETGCSDDPTALDRARGTVLRITFAALEADEFAGVNIEEPEAWGVHGSGEGYDLRGGTHLVFDARSPGGDAFRFLFGGGEAEGFQSVPATWKTFSIPLAEFDALEPMSDVHLLFGVVTDEEHAAAGATLLLDDVRVEPPPRAREDVVSLPVGNETFGVLPRREEATGRVPLPPDQVIRNLATLYESALVAMALLDRGTPADRAAARTVLDAFVYALGHENEGLPLPEAEDGISGLHSGYASGDLALHNDQLDGGRAGQVRLAGFSASESLCGPSGFCVVLDGATGGNNAFALIALLHGFERLGDRRYLDAAREIAEWIFRKLFDGTEEGFGGYFLGYPDRGVPAPKPLLRGKSIENVADIYAAFARLARVERDRGRPAAARRWTERANAAGDFVLEMFDAESGCFFAGTVPSTVEPSPGIDPSGAQRGDDVVNEFLFVDANTFTALALAESARYRNAIDWRRPARCALERFERSVEAAGRRFRGFGIDPETIAGPEGVAWEFTAQIPVLLHLVDRLYGESTFEDEANAIVEGLREAQRHAPFADGRGLVAATLEEGSAVPPREQCLSTPFQCIPERVGLAATAWGIAAERDLNYLPEPVPSRLGGVALLALAALGGAGRRGSRHSRRRGP